MVLLETSCQMVSFRDNDFANKAGLKINDTAYVVVLQHVNVNVTKC